MSKNEHTDGLRKCWESNMVAILGQQAKSNSMAGKWHTAGLGGESNQSFRKLGELWMSHFPMECHSILNNLLVDWLSLYLLCDHMLHSDC